jgi:hypothetical protein
LMGASTEIRHPRAAEGQNLRQGLADQHLVQITAGSVDRTAPEPPG